MIYLTQKIINYLANTAIFSSKVVFADGIHGGSGAVDVSPPSVLRIVPANSHGHAVQAGGGSWGNMGNDHLKEGSLFQHPTLTRLPVGEAGGCCVRIRGSVHPLPLVDARVLPICLQT